MAVTLPEPQAVAKPPPDWTPGRGTKLKGKDPKAAAPSKPKILIFGKPGVGKTWGALEFPAVYYIDTEGGANLGHYTDRLKKAGGLYMGPEDGALDGNVLIDQFHGLATEKHPYKTVVIDSITKIFNKIVADEAERLGDKDGFGASKKPAIAWMRRFLNWVNRIDMNVIFIAHERDVWGPGGSGKVGDTFDCWDKLEYELHLALQIQKRGASRVAVVRKSRLEGFPEGEAVPWSYEEFAKRYGRDIIESGVKTITLADAVQVAKVKELVETVRVTEEEISKWFTKAQITKWEEMDSESINKCIEALKGKIK